MGGVGEKLATLCESCAGALLQLEISFMQYGGRAECATAIAAAQLALRNLAQLRVQRREQGAVRRPTGARIDGVIRWVGQVRLVSQLVWGHLDSHRPRGRAEIHVE